MTDSERDAAEAGIEQMGSQFSGGSVVVAHRVRAVIPYSPRTGGQFADIDGAVDREFRDEAAVEIDLRRHPDPTEQLNVGDHTNVPGHTSSPAVVVVSLVQAAGVVRSALRVHVTAANPPPRLSQTAAKTAAVDDFFIRD